MESRRRDIYTSLFFIVLSLGILGVSLTIKGRTIAAIGPDFMPKVVGSLLLFLAVGLLVQSVLQPGAPRQVEPKRKEGGKNLPALLIVIAILLSYVLLLELVGFPIMTAIFLASMFYLFDQRKGLKRLVVFTMWGVLIAASLAYLFGGLLHLAIPLGILDR